MKPGELPVEHLPQPITALENTTADPIMVWTRDRARTVMLAPGDRIQFDQPIGGFYRTPSLA